MNQARRHLRAATRTRHDRVDALFGRFDLGSRADYAHFLLAHAAVLPTAEAMVGGVWAEFTPRTPNLMADVADLGLDPPTPHLSMLPDEAQRWGALYVLEGARLGGKVLAERVGPDLPLRYLHSPQAPGAWARFQDRLEAALPEAAFGQAAEGACRMFDAFEAAAAEVLRIRISGSAHVKGRQTAKAP